MYLYYILVFNMLKLLTNYLLGMAITRLKSAKYLRCALDDLVLDLYLRRPEADLTRVETCSPRFIYIYTINKLLY